ncbi:MULTISPECIES: hypothetical protein [Streptomyces]|uniref:Uncharacterized protein n=1 Tax=Streptomyces glycanivorans TaxID=3033808 RepID=A0ABY9J507_9ACTN|nr:MULTISPECIES: hypothetical protein [unclassified Streptomyces]WSQ76429.1 hypothetical protein OG725_04690 [Streptomyces sp. NBC_01213]WLQ62915.1 hypothetical protein P8A20_04600 [Streptomyces sp. Alt3]WSQ83676.1 hypothetical protein OG722_04655 [Streptomyces sp. NBC_01212]WSR10296.1 hypothetical protein OG265_31670 [Streptomyces sp. NBC_01208]WSR47005.1 hypothetical protein OG279_04955 [Streptomyces sp. NBC_01201]
MAPHRTSRHRTTSHQVRHILAALLLGVLALLGGTPATAANALPVPGHSGGHPVGSAAYSAGPVGHGAGTAVPRGDPAADGSGPTGSAAHTAGLVVHASGPDAAVRSDDPARWAEAGPLPGPRAGADRPHAPQHLPPPGHGALPPRPQNLLPPRGSAPGAAGANPFLVARARAALPGVRGPPGVTAGQPARHRSCSADLSSRPSP